jgi:hypothetical protein
MGPPATIDVMDVEHGRVGHSAAFALSAEDQHERVPQSGREASIVWDAIRVVSFLLHPAHAGQIAVTRTNGCSAVGVDLAGCNVAATRNVPHWLHRPLLFMRHRAMRFSHSLRLLPGCSSANRGAMLTSPPVAGGRIGSFCIMAGRARGARDSEMP